MTVVSEKVDVNGNVTLKMGVNAVATGTVGTTSAVVVGVAPTVCKCVERHKQTETGRLFRGGSFPPRLTCHGRLGLCYLVLVSGGRHAAFRPTP